MNRVVTLIWAAAVFGGLGASSARLNAETVVVRLQSGRQLTAAIHQRTDETQLWLQYGSQSVSVIRPLPWQAIAWAAHEGEQLSIPQLKELALRVTGPESPDLPATPDLPETPEGHETASATPTRVLRIAPADQRARDATMAQRAQQSLGFAPPVQSVQFDAILANWDGDVETDGLLLRLYPSDDQGNLAAVSGTLEVEFVARRQRDFNDAPRQGGATADRIGRWSVQVDEADFRPGAATVRLPFQAIHPEFDTDWFSDGIVHVRFSVAGVGTFEQSMDGIRTRPFAPLRDATQLQSGRRFLPSERTGRGQREQGQPGGGRRSDG